MVLSESGMVEADVYGSLKIPPELRTERLDCCLIYLVDLDGFVIRNH